MNRAESMKKGILLLSAFLIMILLSIIAIVFLIVGKEEHSIVESYALRLNASFMGFSQIEKAKATLQWQFFKGKLPLVPQNIYDYNNHCSSKKDYIYLINEESKKVENYNILQCTIIKDISAEINIKSFQDSKDFIQFERIQDILKKEGKIKNNIENNLPFVSHTYFIYKIIRPIDIENRIPYRGFPELRVGSPVYTLRQLDFAEKDISLRNVTPVNINTAPPDVLVSLITGLSGYYIKPYMPHQKEIGPESELQSIITPLFFLEKTPPIKKEVAESIVQQLINYRRTTPFTNFQQLYEFLTTMEKQGLLTEAEKEIIYVNFNPEISFVHLPHPLKKLIIADKTMLINYSNEITFFPIGLFDIEANVTITYKNSIKARHFQSSMVNLWNTDIITTKEDFTKVVVDSKDFDLYPNTLYTKKYEKIEGAIMNKTIPVSYEKLSDNILIYSSFDKKIEPDKNVCPIETGTKMYDKPLLFTDGVYSETFAPLVYNGQCIIHTVKEDIKNFLPPNNKEWETIGFSTYQKITQIDKKDDKEKTEETSFTDKTVYIRFEDNCPLKYFTSDFEYKISFSTVKKIIEGYFSFISSEMDIQTRIMDYGEQWNSDLEKTKKSFTGSELSDAIQFLWDKFSLFSYTIKSPCSHEIYAFTNEEIKNHPKGILCKEYVSEAQIYKERGCYYNEPEKTKYVCRITNVFTIIDPIVLEIIIESLEEIPGEVKAQILKKFKEHEYYKQCNEIKLRDISEKEIQNYFSVVYSRIPRVKVMVPTKHLTDIVKEGFKYKQKQIKHFSALFDLVDRKVYRRIYKSDNEVLTLMRDGLKKFKELVDGYTERLEKNEDVEAYSTCKFSPPELWPEQPFYHMVDTLWFKGDIPHQNAPECTKYFIYTHGLVDYIWRCNPEIRKKLYELISNAYSTIFTLYGYLRKKIPSVETIKSIITQKFELYKKGFRPVSQMEEFGTNIYREWKKINKLIIANFFFHPVAIETSVFNEDREKVLDEWCKNLPYLQTPVCKALMVVSQNYYICNPDIDKIMKELEEIKIDEKNDEISKNVSQFFTYAQFAKQHIIASSFAEEEFIHQKMSVCFWIKPYPYLKNRPFYLMSLSKPHNTYQEYLNFKNSLPSLNNYDYIISSELDLVGDKNSKIFFHPYRRDGVQYLAVWYNDIINPTMPMMLVYDTTFPGKGGNTYSYNYTYNIGYKNWEFVCLNIDNNPFIEEKVKIYFNGTQVKGTPNEFLSDNLTFKTANILENNIGLRFGEIVTRNFGATEYKKYDPYFYGNPGLNALIDEILIVKESDEDFIKSTYNRGRYMFPNHFTIKLPPDATLVNINILNPYDVSFVPENLKEIYTSLYKAPESKELKIYINAQESPLITTPILENIIIYTPVHKILSTSSNK